MWNETLTDQGYLIEVAEKYGLYKHIRFNSTVDEARWDNTALKWRVGVSVSGAKDSQYIEGYEMESDFLVSAVGQLNVPQEPNIPGLHCFQGKTMHSARWDWSYDLKGKRIAVIGNGATAVQIVPEVAKVASHLTVYQRTPNWIVPRADRSVTGVEKALFAYVPFVQWAKRAIQMDMREYFHGAVTDANSELSQTLRKLSLDMMKKQLPDRPDLWDKLTPNYSPGCKRVLITDDYYPTLAQEHVDLETRHITRITETGIETEDGDLQECDLIVLATGFRSVEFMFPIQVYGMNGRPLSDIWKGGAMAYNGVTVEDLPNFAMLYGPNTNLGKSGTVLALIACCCTKYCPPPPGHNSIILMIEAQSRYLNGMIGEVLRARQQGKSLAVRPRAETVQQYNETIQAQLRTSAFADPNCNSWYKTEDGRITNNWPGTVPRYQGELSRVRWEDYLVEGSGREGIGGRRKSTHVGRVHEGNLVSTVSAVLGTVGVLLAAGRYYYQRAI